MKMAAPFYGSIIKQVKVTNVETTGNTASGVATLHGKPSATFQMTKSNGKWIISGERRAGTTSSNSSTQSGPTQSRLTAVSSCLTKAGVSSENAGSESTGGVPHQVLSVDASQLTVAMLDVFASPAAANSAYAAIRSSSAPAQATLVGSSVVVYLRPVAAAQRTAIEACG